MICPAGPDLTDRSPWRPRSRVTTSCRTCDMDLSQPSTLGPQIISPSDVPLQLSRAQQGPNWPTASPWLPSFGVTTSWCTCDMKLSQFSSPTRFDGCRTAIALGRHFCQIPFVQPKTEEFLNLLLWSAEILARPTFRNLTESYEGWAYRKGLRRQLYRLERKGFVERDRSSLDDRLHRLTSKGRLHALGGRDPDARWNCAWDGGWRLVVFDVPM